MKILKNIAAIIAGIAVYWIAYCLSVLVVSLLGSIPIIGSFLYYPSDAAWALIVLPVADGAFLGAFVSSKIAKNVMPFSIIMIAYWVIIIISLFVGNTFTWAWLIRSIFAIISLVLCMAFQGEDTTITFSANKKAKRNCKQEALELVKEYAGKNNMAIREYFIFCLQQEEIDAGIDRNQAYQNAYKQASKHSNDSTLSFNLIKRYAQKNSMTIPDYLDHCKKLSQVQA